MLIFSGSSNKPLAEKIAKKLNLDLSSLEITLFPDNENRVRVIDRVLDQDVVVVQSAGVTPNLYYMELFFIIDSLKRSGATSITLVIPYFGYQRQDHIFREGEGVSLEVIIKIIENLGVDKLISFDLHSSRIPELFHIPIVHLSALPIFAEEIRKLDEKDLVLVSPDMGGKRRLKQLSEMLGGVKMASINKDRDLKTGEVELSDLEGDTAKTAVIIDDVISTGKTAIAAANILKEKGVENIYLMVTHGIFAARASGELQKSAIKEVYVSDSIDVNDKKRFQKLKVVSIVDPIGDALKS